MDKRGCVLMGGHEQVANCTRAIEALLSGGAPAP